VAVLRSKLRPAAAAVVMLGIGLSACGGSEEATPSDATRADRAEASVESSASPSVASSDDDGSRVDGVPRVIDVHAVAGGDGTYRFDVTISSPYDRPEKYADAWRVVGSDGEVYGVRELAHDHAGEQPFTRSLDDVAVPAGVTTVVVEARDLIDGWSGETFEVEFPSG
jgi:hypothetical protein